MTEYTCEERFAAFFGPLDVSANKRDYVDKTLAEFREDQRRRLDKERDAIRNGKKEPKRSNERWQLTLAAKGYTSDVMMVDKGNGKGKGKKKRVRKRRS